MPTLSLVEKTVNYKGQIAASPIDANVSLLPVTTGNTYDASQAAIVNSKINESGDADAVFKSFVNYGTAQAPAYREDTTSPAKTACAIHFAVTVSAGEHPSSNLYTLKAGCKNENTVVTDQWVLAFKGASAFDILDMSGAKTTAVSAKTDIAQTTSAQTFEFLLWADGTHISDAIGAISSMVVFSLTLQ